MNFEPGDILINEEMDIVGYLIREDFPGWKIKWASGAISWVHRNDIMMWLKIGDEAETRWTLQKCQKSVI